MTYEEAKQEQAQLEAAVKLAGEPLRQFPRRANGLTPDAIKFSQEYQQAKAAFDLAFAKLRAFNGPFVKQFCKELRAERRARGYAPQV